MTGPSGATMMGSGTGAPPRRRAFAQLARGLSLATAHRAHDVTLGAFAGLLRCGRLRLGGWLGRRRLGRRFGGLGCVTSDRAFDLLSFFVFLLARRLGIGTRRLRLAWIGGAILGRRPDGFDSASTHTSADRMPSLSAKPSRLRASSASSSYASHIDLSAWSNPVSLGGRGASVRVVALRRTWLTRAPKRSRHGSRRTCIT